MIATPYGASFDHLRIADEAQFKFDRCMRALSGEAYLTRLPVYGVGHSLGSLVHMLICARYAVLRQVRACIWSVDTLLHCNVSG